MFSFQKISCCFSSFSHWSFQYISISDALIPIHSFQTSHPPDLDPCQLLKWSFYSIPLLVQSKPVLLDIFLKTLPALIATLTDLLQVIHERGGQIVFEFCNTILEKLKELDQLRATAHLGFSKKMGNLLELLNKLKFTKKMQSIFDLLDFGFPHGIKQPILDSKFLYFQLLI